MKKSITLLSLLLFAYSVFAQVPVTLATPPKLQFFLPNGAPNAFGCVWTYASGTTTPLASYTDYSGSTQNQNPVNLDAGGFANIWLQSGQLYSIKVVSTGGVNCVSGSTQYTVKGINQSLLNLSNTWQQPQTFTDAITLLPADSQIVFGAASGSQTTLDIPSTTLNLTLHGPPLTASNDTLDAQNTDRKSTRLNSSHLGISY